MKYKMTSIFVGESFSPSWNTLLHLFLFLQEKQNFSLRQEIKNEIFWIVGRVLRMNYGWAVVSHVMLLLLLPTTNKKSYNLGISTYDIICRVAWDVEIECARYSVSMLYYVIWQYSGKIRISVNLMRSISLKFGSE